MFGCSLKTASYINGGVGGGKSLVQNMFSTFEKWKNILSNKFVLSWPPKNNIYFHPTKGVKLEKIFFRRNKQSINGLTSRFIPILETSLNKKIKIMDVNI